ncbi:glutamate dehydrogenase [Alteribacillus bidgolensis]|uniref:Glutamate dehydrogenase n=1 Tax=Alteribacillus bidgolensis TaxID=930129 RepID=A0A1G8K7R7_9BACI|nr:glutamate dehydrogenase [Alteribacillus bidgolensis]
MVTNQFKNTITNEELLEKECDILIPAAISNQITARNADRIQARVVVEAANGPTTPEATDILTEKDVLLIPDVLASSGGVIVSYFEWVQNNQGYYWSEEEVEQNLHRKMVQSFHQVYETSSRYKTDMRTASYIAGTRKMAEAALFRGWV